MSKKAEKIVDAVLKELRRLRKVKGLTYDQLSQLTGIHRTTFSLIERQKRIPTILTCLKICEALEVQLEDILKKLR